MRSIAVSVRSATEVSTLPGAAAPGPHSFPPPRPGLLTEREEEIVWTGGGLSVRGRAVLLYSDTTCQVRLQAPQDTPVFSKLLKVPQLTSL